MSGLDAFALGQPREVEQNFELNLAPIIDCLTVLITFMLASASFVAVTMIDAGFSPDALITSSAASGAPEVTLSLTLKSDHSLMLTTAGKENLALKLNAKDNKWDLERLSAELSRLKTQGKVDPNVSLGSDDLIEYQELIQVMDQVRKTFPQVVLGGI